MSHHLSLVAPIPTKCLTSALGFRKKRACKDLLLKSCVVILPNPFNVVCSDL